MYALPHASPAGHVPEGRGGRTTGRLWLLCSTIYPLHRARHTAKRMYGRGTSASPCAHEGEVFEPGADWWEPAVEIVPEAVAAGAAELVAGSPAKGTAP